MRRRRYIRGNFDRRDLYRPIVTETVPFEVPIIFSNDGFYVNLLEHKETPENLKEFVSKLVLTNPASYTVPYRYKIAKDSLVARQLSLLHPAAQAGVCEFYKNYENLICYYCSKSEFSIRYPAKVGSSYFFKGTLADRNKYKADTVDTVKLDKAVRNPASYFAYKDYDRLYKFFDSSDFVRLEKKFAHMMLLDVGNCFGSIYTHSISWAVKSINHAKENVRTKSFGNNFDRIMQRMNFNETNGICIGPEVSRIFAEIIFQRIDDDVLKAAAAKSGLRSKVDYECRRYVDDYIIFTRNHDDAVKLQAIISDCLSNYHLRLNERKVEHYGRPFQTKKSQIIVNVDQRLGEFNRNTFDRAQNRHRSLVPKHIYNSSSRVKSFIGGMKACCFELSVGYEMIANYVISSLGATLEDLIDSYLEIRQQEKEDEPEESLIDDEQFVTAFLVLLEIMYFFYSVEPTVASSFKIAKATILSCRFFQHHQPSKKALLAEHLSNWMMLIVRSTRSEQHRSTVPLEVMNIVLALSELDADHLVDPEHLIKNIFPVPTGDYFTLISCLYYVKNAGRYVDVKEAVQRRIVELVERADLLRDSQPAHLILDVLSCPYLPKAFRTDLLLKIAPKIGVLVRSKSAAAALVDEIQHRPWFVRWEKVDLLNMVRKKELSVVY